MSTRNWFRPAHAPGLQLPLTLTAVVLLLRPMGPWYVQAPLLALGVLGVVVRRTTRMPGLWALAAVAMAVRLVVDWPLPDNHIYLLACWCLAMALALGGPAPAVDLSVAARLLLAGAMTCAVLWKALLSPDYLDGRFFRVTLIEDPRFESVTLLVGAMSDATLQSNRAVLQPLPEGAVLADPPVLVEPVGVRLLARVLTWGGVVLEAAIALVMWIPAAAMRRAQHALLLAFCVLTYAIAPVAGFGWLLLIMGLCLCGPRQSRLRFAYTAVFFVVLFVTEVPWASLLLDAVRAGTASLRGL